VLWSYTLPNINRFGVSPIAAKVVGQGFELYELRGINLSLEEIFLQLTTEDPAHKSTA
jgi:hypothetical protein